jgi:hypothetical protein
MTKAAGSASAARLPPDTSDNARREAMRRVTSELPAQFSVPRVR